MRSAAPWKERAEICEVKIQGKGESLRIKSHCQVFGKPVRHFPIRTMDPHLREEVDVHTDQMERPFLLQDLRRFLRLDPIRDVAEIGEGGEEGRMKARPVHSDDLRQFITGQGSGNLGGQEGGRGG